jgi:hypothetical protein
MARPRKAETKVHQINLRFTAPEFVKIHHHAAITGKTVNEFGRSVLLRRPRRRKGGAPPTVIAWPEDTLAKWHVLGTRLNGIAHIMNARDGLPPGELLPLLGQLRALFKNSFAELLTADPLPAYALAPPVRHHLRKVGVNLAQMARRFDQLGMEPPIALVRLLERIRTLMNGDQPPDAA